MQQNDINRAVAHATGESVSRIKRIGFLLADPEVEFFDPEDELCGPQVIDWDEPDVSLTEYREPIRAAS